jgi:hypothetical protein
MMGLLVAPVEWAGGKVVINQLSKVASTEAAKSGIKSLLKSIGAQAATNFTTEAATEALNIVSELAVMQDKSQAVQYYNDYLQNHPGSESMALVDTMMQQLARIGQAGLAGAVAGGMMGAAATVWHRAQIEQMGHAGQADAQAIVQEGLSYSEGTQAYQQATEINQQMKEGEHPGDVQLGGLMETNAATDLDRQQITSALESRDGQPVDNAGQAGYAGNKVEGEGIERDTHTDSGGTEAPAEPTTPQTENVQQSESTEAGQGANAEGDFSHQSVGDAAEGAGDYNSLVEKAKSVDVSSGAHQAVFYSGEGNRARAEAFAELNGKTTLEMTPGGKYFDSLDLFGKNSPLTDDQAYEIWSILSERYAKGASGNVYGFVDGARPGSIFNTVEYPALKKTPYITNIFTELFK